MRGRAGDEIRGTAGALLILTIFIACAAGRLVKGEGGGAPARPGDPAAKGSPPPSVATAPAPAGAPCPDLFRQDVLRTYSIDISPAEWAALTAEFHNVAALAAQGNDFAARHPVVFRLGGETVTDATLRLHGQSSWVTAVTHDGPRAKMQFDVSFHQVDPNGRFHGVEKLVFDMPRDDWTFLHDRLAHSWLRQAGIAVGCATNARVEINGSYYGLYTVEENTNRRIIRQFFPDDPEGDLWKGGVQPETNQAAPNWRRQASFWRASDIGAVAAIVDVRGSVAEWANEALLNDADGYYNGNHNFYLYDQGEKGFVFLPDDTDSTFDWLVFNDRNPFNNHPVFWWEGRYQPTQKPGRIWLAVMNDPASRKLYVDALAAAVARWDVRRIQGWIDTWSRQIAADVASDPHAVATPASFRQAVAAARDLVARRAAYLQSYVDCERSGVGVDRDGDGVRWCEDCREDDAAVHPGAPEVCGNGIDDDCNGLIDDGCPR